MRILALMVLAILLLNGCQPGSTEAQPSPTPQVWESRLQEGLGHFEQQHYEDAAVVLRETLDLMDEHQAPQQKITLAHEKCVKALCKAGGHLESQTLWKSLLEKNPDAKVEAQRMISRAEKVLRLQGDELVVQGLADKKEGHISKARATISAAIYLYQETGGSETQAAAASKILEEIEAPLSPTSSPEIE